MTPEWFLSQPIRDVEVRYVKHAACGAFAIVTVDFEPQRYGFGLDIARGVRLEVDEYGQDYRDVFAYVDALAVGIAQELGTRPDLDVRARAILRRMVIHPVDSNEMAFRHAGRLAARAALERFIPGAASPPDRFHHEPST